jgi:hypothetical protein
MALTTISFLAGSHISGSMVHHRLPTCPVCQREDTVVVHEDLGADGHFCMCAGPDGCGSTFVLNPDGSLSDIF